MDPYVDIDQGRATYWPGGKLADQGPAHPDPEAAGKADANVETPYLQSVDQYSYPQPTDQSDHSDAEQRETLVDRDPHPLISNYGNGPFNTSGQPLLQNA